MPKVLCSLPNASTEIAGVQFTKHATGMLSEDVSAEVAARFAKIRGYTVVGAPEPEVDADAEKADADAEKAAAEAEKAALLERAEAIQFKAKSTWGLDRLRNEVEAAEKAAEATK